MFCLPLLHAIAALRRLSTMSVHREGGQRVKEDEPDVLQMLIDHELAIKELYGLFAMMFKSHEGFWQHLAADEQRHANRLASLQSDPLTGNWLRWGGQVKPQAIRTSIGYVESQTAKAKKGDFSLLQALSVARDLESALLERQFSRLKDSAPKEIGFVLTSLANETEKHLKTVVEALNEEKRRAHGAR